MVQKMAAKLTSKSPTDNSPRLVLPRTLCAVLTVLIDELEPGDHRAVYLRTARSTIERVYKIDRVNEVELAQDLAEEDGEEVTDASP